MTVVNLMPSIDHLATVHTIQVLPGLVRNSMIDPMYFMDYIYIYISMFRFIALFSFLSDLKGIETN